jgi:hypothetical protein
MAYKIVVSQEAYPSRPNKQMPQGSKSFAGLCFLELW